MVEESFNSRFGQAMTPELYAEQWSSASTYLAESGQYAWMEKQLGEAAKVLEVGCGSGRSTLALAQARSVVALEVNEPAIAATKRALIEAGVTVEVVQPGDLIYPSSARVRLVLGSLFDNDVFASLAGVSFDAVVCWLIGASPDVIAATFSKKVSDFSGGEAADYRTLIHKRCYELGRLCLKPGNVLHVVDRIVIGSWADKDHHREEQAEMHEEIAGSGYIINKAGTLFRRLDSLGKSDIQYLAPKGTNGILVLGSVKATRT